MEEKALPDIFAIERVSFPNTWPESTFWGEIQNRNISFPMVAVHNALKRVIGYIIFWQIKDEAQINNIAAHPEFRKMGIEVTLLINALGKMRNQGVKFVSLEVWPSSTAAQNLYSKLGFVLLGTRKRFYTNPEEDALVLGLDLG